MQGIFFQALSLQLSHLDVASSLYLEQDPQLCEDPPYSFFYLQEASKAYYRILPYNNPPIVMQIADVVHAKRIISYLVKNCNNMSQDHATLYYECDASPLLLILPQNPDEEYSSGFSIICSFAPRTIDLYYSQPNLCFAQKTDNSAVLVSAPCIYRPGLRPSWPQTGEYLRCGLSQNAHHLPR